MVVPLPRDPRAALVDPVVVREQFDACVEAGDLDQAHAVLSAALPRYASECRTFLSGIGACRVECGFAGGAL